jgi:hypothetical protein
MFQLETPTRVKMRQVADKAIKVGQKDTKPAVILTTVARLPNAALDMFDPALRALLYSKAAVSEKVRKQAAIEGVDEVSDTPALTPTGANLATLSWGQEQSGCTMAIDYGLGDERSNIVLRDGTAKGFKITLEDGGAIKVVHHFHAPVDTLSAEQLGKLHLMHQRDVKVTLVVPKVEQQDLDDDAGDGAKAPPSSGRKGGSTVTPIQALANADKQVRSGKDAAAGN